MYAAASYGIPNALNKNRLEITEFLRDFRDVVEMVGTSVLV